MFPITAGGDLNHTEGTGSTWVRVECADGGYLNLGNLRLSVSTGSPDDESCEIRLVEVDALTNEETVLYQRDIEPYEEDLLEVREHLWSHVSRIKHAIYTDSQPENLRIRNLIRDFKEAQSAVSEGS